MTAVQLALDCDPTWTDEPSDRPPTPFALRQHEMHDLRHQGTGPLALWNATTIHPDQEYL